jgi:hypothetical protein
MLIKIYLIGKFLYQLNHTYKLHFRFFDKTVNRN